MATSPRTLGSSDLVISGVGLGGNNFSRPNTPTATQDGSTAVLHAALDHGITFIDTAELYGAEPGMSETFIGQALRGRRDEAVIATKWGHTRGGADGVEANGPRGSEPHIRAAIEGSLRRLQTDRVDLFQLHEPDPDVPIEETIGALGQLVAEGKVLHVGHSNFSLAQTVEADDAAARLGAPRFVSAQVEYSLLERGIEAELLPLLREREIGLLPFFPLYNGLLTGKYTRAGDGEGRLSKIKPQILETVDWDQLEAYRAVCDEVGAPMVQVSIAWLLAQPGVASVIAGATSPEQIAVNAGAGELRLSDDVVARISEIFG